MARLEVITVEDGFCRGLLEQFKQYASVPDDSRDALLVSLLRTALLRVQESADRALLSCTVRQTCLVPEATGKIRLYLGGGEIVSITGDWREPVPFDPLPGPYVQTYVRGKAVEVVFTTDPKEADRAELMPTVFRYATALYDGEDAAVLASILKEVVR